MSAPPAAADALRAVGLTYPEAHLKSPWPGHADLAVQMFEKHLTWRAEHFPMSRKKVAAVLSGANVDSDVFARVLAGETFSSPG